MRHLAILIALLLPVSASAAPGDLDPTFGAGGLVTSAPSPGSDRARGVAIQPDGKIVVTGWIEPGGVGPQMIVMRYNANGTLDTSFDGDGLVVGQANTRGWAVAIQPDGKIVIGGTQFIGAEANTCVWRFNPDGSPDSTFNGTGRRVHEISFFFSDEVYAIALQGDGKIVAVGTARHDDNPDHDFLTMRFMPDGSFDNTWDMDGIAITPMAALHDSGWAIAIQTDGRIVVAGEGGITTTTRSLAVARYNADGSLDTGFDGDGRLFRNFSSNETARCVALQPDGKIIVGGIINGVMGIFRFNSNGSTDSSFGGVGRRSFGFTDSIAEAVMVQSDGKIVTIGHGFAGSGRFFAVTRVLSDASDDTVFGPDGFFVTTSFGPGTSATAEAALLQPDGNILVAGYVQGGPHVSHDVALARYIGDFAPTAATVSISGRVMDPEGRGVSGARLFIDAPSGERRTAITNPLGYFSVEGVEVGEVYLVSVAHKRYSFAPRSIHVVDEVTDLVIMAEMVTGGRSH